MPEDLKLSQIGAFRLPPPFRGLHSPGVRKHCQIIFVCYFRKSSIAWAWPHQAWPWVQCHNSIISCPRGIHRKRKHTSTRKQKRKSSLGIQRRRDTRLRRAADKATSSTKPETPGQESARQHDVSAPVWTTNDTSIDLVIALSLHQNCKWTSCMARSTGL